MKSFLILFLALSISSFGQTRGILYSRIGYDLNSDKRIIVRSDNRDIPENTIYKIYNSKDKLLFSGKPKYWGKKWKSHWWILGCNSIKEEGKYRCEFLDMKTKEFEVSKKLLWNKTWKSVTIDQLEARVILRNNNIKNHGPEHAEGGGWQDCGGRLREVNSHATTLVALFDMIESGHISKGNKKKIAAQAVIGLDYMAFCQDKAKLLGKGDGAIIHAWPNHKNVVTGDVAKAALVFARSAQLLKRYNKVKAKEYLTRAKKAFNWIDKNGPITHPGGTSFSKVVLPDDGFDRIPYGAPKGYKRPDDWKTRDLVMMCWAAVELSKLEKSFSNYAFRYASKIMSRQIPKENPEGKFYGHFKTFYNSPFTEKACEHHHMGYDTGSTFPHYLIPFFELINQYPKHKDYNKWKKCLDNFAYGYMLPACSENPFNLFPMGYFTNEGILNFSGMWHGMNGIYGSGAALALEFYTYTKDERFKNLATANLQWIAGLNSGVKEKDRYVSKSMIYGIGDEYIGSWTKTPGTICNGFEADGQFQYTEPTAENDGPFVFTDEGWITHSGGWISAISRLNNIK